MPLYRRLPKRGFKSLSAQAEVRLSDLEKLAGGEVDRLTLIQSGLVSSLADKIKVIGTGTISIAVNLRGIGATESAKAAILAAGGSVE